MDNTENVSNITSTPTRLHWSLHLIFGVLLCTQIFFISGAFFSHETFVNNGYSSFPQMAIPCAIDNDDDPRNGCGKENYIPKPEYSYLDDLKNFVFPMSHGGYSLFLFLAPLNLLYLLIFIFVFVAKFVDKKIRLGLVYTIVLLIFTPLNPLFFKIGGFLPFSENISGFGFLIGLLLSTIAFIVVLHHWFYSVNESRGVTLPQTNMGRFGYISFCIGIVVFMIIVSSIFPGVGNIGFFVLGLIGLSVFNRLFPRTIAFYFITLSILILPLTLFIITGPGINSIKDKILTSPLGCKIQSRTNSTNECYMELAVKNKNPDLCYQFSDEHVLTDNLYSSPRSKCFAFYTTRTGDWNVCQKVVYESGYLVLPSYQDWCTRKSTSLNAIDYKGDIYTVKYGEQTSTLTELPPAIVGQLYSADLPPAYNFAPPTKVFSVTAAPETLPQGLSIVSDFSKCNGENKLCTTLVGTPVNLGTYNFSVDINNGEYSILYRLKVLE